ncbi:MarR family winged helix-turn-helix transcriptional regulator [Streptomyces sp. NPDC050560]|uniref:MarR family winged helix-turn-helix transcriptional regulator n=1 Tax=Streptomyces sp. NPDC050560 TaxID=3365630 RepID=UPI0037A7478D
MPENGTASESAVRAARELRIVFSRLRRRLKETYDTEGFTPSQTSAVSRLNRQGPMSASDLAAAEGVRPQSIAATLAVLDERGMITRSPDPGDRRRQLVALSAAGAAFLTDRRRLGEEWLATALEEKCTEAERATVIEAMALVERLIGP